MHFSLSRSGVLSLDRAEAVIEITEWIEVPIKKNLTLETNKENSTTINPETGSANNDATKDGTKDPDTENSANDANSSSTKEEEKKNTEEVKTEKVLKKRTFRVPLKVKFIFFQFVKEVNNMINKSGSLYELHARSIFFMFFICWMMIMYTDSGEDSRARANSIKRTIC
jgi:hypothetical protein